MFILIFKIINKRLGQRPVLITSLLLILVGFCALSFGPQKIFGTQLSYLILVSGRFSIAMGSYGVSINGYLLGILFLKALRIKSLYYTFLHIIH